jgi:glycosyltransferase involved in cell wall biosynthesis
MKILVFTINPIFPDKVTGGASKHLYYITKYLSDQGHQVEILCPKSDDQKSSFSLHPRVNVHPELPFNLPFPQPYAISPADLSWIMSRIIEKLQHSDRFYIHDGEWLIPDIYQNIPTIVSYRDNIYPESILGSFIGKPDDIICVSDYSAAVIEETAGLFYPDLRDRIHVVPNGIDFNLFKPVETRKLAMELGVNPERDIVLLHPHRPEEGKGLAETIRVAHRLVHKHGLHNIRVLIPEWIDSMVSSVDSAFYNAMMRLMQDLGVADHFVFVPWMPIERMPELFSIGNVTLCLGNIVEAFGNVAYESLACGTPSIVSRTGVHRTLLPDDLIDKVHFGDIDAAVSRILDIVAGGDWNREKVQDALKSKMNIQRQVENYGEIIVNCKKQGQLEYRLPASGRATFYTLPSWCYFKGDLIYHDYYGKFENASELASLLSSTDKFSELEAHNFGITQEMLKQWLEKTWIIPVLNYKEN